MRMPEFTAAVSLSNTVTHSRGAELGLPADADVRPAGFAESYSECIYNCVRGGAYGCYAFCACYAHGGTTRTCPVLF
jgi:hypothetical protein